MVSFKSLLLAATSLVSIAQSRKVFIENDGLEALQLLIPLYGGVEVVGMSMSFGSYSAVDAVAAGYNVLKEYNMTSCIPLYLGAQQPLLQTNDTFQMHSQLFGAPVWEGGFSPDYEDSYTWDEVDYDQDTPGAIALIEAVKKYKDTDPVMIFAAGMMTTVAQALSIYPKLAEEAAGLYIMGGYIDTQYAQAVGTAIQVDINTDINLIQDPEGAQIALTAPWKELYIGGNVTNYLVPSQELYNRIIAKAGSLEAINNNTYFTALQDIVYTGNYAENNDQETLPFWDDVVSFFMTYPELITSSTNVSCAVDTSFYSPFYGNLRIWGADFAPTAGVKVGNGTLVNSIVDSQFYDTMIEVLFQDWTQYCHTGTYAPLAGY
ncbi:hypothetical protein DASC09_059950 [Saccharomycopsis crataegensis]|uniref:Inosine/uridine-preferring nucleoside hydrolase domain-containing protein n=1 Tax=Saccharomycopsis crataegensis TaxID=43959 RepID=A0AAV5QVW5_9ASCO|nr:hypothetical protein DASC09_059950 [Saccharomycopsis crataegensis]